MLDRKESDFEYAITSEPLTNSKACDVNSSGIIVKHVFLI